MSARIGRSVSVIISIILLVMRERKKGNSRKSVSGSYVNAYLKLLVNTFSFKLGKLEMSLHLTVPSAAQLITLFLSPGHNSAQNMFLVCPVRTS
jgi:hypothetical protein